MIFKLKRLIEFISKKLRLKVKGRMAIMKKIITALQNENVNKKLAEYDNVKIMANDIQYQEGILEVLEVEENIDFIIFSELLPGSMKIEELIEKIKQKNENIKIIVILENKKEELENYLLGKGKIFIFYNNEITIEQLIKVIEEKSNQEIIEQELLELKKMINKENEKVMPTEKIENAKSKNYFLTKEQNEEIEKEIEEEFYKNKIINRIYNFFHNKEKNKLAQIIFIMGLKGCRKNNIHNKPSRTNER